MSDGPKNPFTGGPMGDPFDDMDEFLRRMGIDPRDFQSLFGDMQRAMQDAFRQLGEDPSRGFVSGFNVRMGPDGKPHIGTFGNKPTVQRDGGVPSVGVDPREPLTDVIEDPQSVAITMELPGVAKSDIDLHMTEERLEIAVDTEARKYHKTVRLPAKVDPATTKATYNNGVLDVTVQKVDKSEPGVRVNID